MKLETNEQRIIFLNQKAEEISKQQEENLVADYDAALEEYRNKNKPHLIKFKGKFYEVPRSMPFSFSMFYMRYCIKKKNGKTIFQVPDDKLSEFLTRIFGKKFAEAVENSDVEINFVMQELVPDIMSRWGSPVKKGESPQASTPAS